MLFQQYFPKLCDFCSLLLFCYFLFLFDYLFVCVEFRCLLASARSGVKPMTGFLEVLERLPLPDKSFEHFPIFCLLVFVISTVGALYFTPPGDPSIPSIHLLKAPRYNIRLSRVITIVSLHWWMDCAPPSLTINCYQRQH